MKVERPRVHGLLMVPYRSGLRDALQGTPPRSHAFQGTFEDSYAYLAGYRKGLERKHRHSSEEVRHKHGLGPKAHLRRKKHSKYSPEARTFVEEKVRKLREEGYKEKTAVAIALSMARKRGMKVPAYPKSEKKHRHEGHEERGMRRELAIVGTRLMEAAKIRPGMRLVERDGYVLPIASVDPIGNKVKLTFADVSMIRVAPKILPAEKRVYVQVPGEE